MGASARLMGGRVRFVRALAVAVVSCAAFFGLLWVLIDPLEFADRGPAFLLVVPAACVVLWLRLSMALARAAAH